MILRIQKIALFLLWGVAMATFPATAIIIRHDRDDTEYLKLGDRYQQILCRMLSFGGEGTLISPQWVITAAHVAKAMQTQEPIAPVLINGKEYAVEKIILHPEWKGNNSRHDIALVKLKDAVPIVQSVRLYPNTDELGKTITIIGRGYSGTGLTGMDENKNDRQLRGAMNQIDKVSKDLFRFKFDDPREGRALELEGINGANDSGSPALIESEGNLYIVGVSSGDERNGRKLGQYGVDDIYVRVSSYLDWIEKA